jgi:hypothetical protein
MESVSSIHGLDQFLFSPDRHNLIACLDSARRLCAWLLSEEPRRLPVSECERVQSRLRDILPQVPADKVAGVQRLLMLLRQSAGEANADRSVFFDPLDLARDPQAFWAKIDWNRRAELRECHRQLTQELQEVIDAGPVSPAAAYLGITPDGLPVPPPIGHDLYVVHCSTEPLAADPVRTPRVFAVGLRHVVSGQVVTFAAHRTAEQQRMQISRQPRQLEKLEAASLQEFFAFLADRPCAVLLHWNMNGTRFGFEALAQRYRLHWGSPPVLPPPCQRFDLAAFLKRKFGGDYTDHPRLDSLVRLNGLIGAAYLDEEKAADAWRRGDWAGLEGSLVFKLGAIEALYRLLRENKLRTNLGLVGALGVVGAEPDHRLTVCNKGVITNAANSGDQPELPEREQEILKALLLKAEGKHRRVLREKAARRADPGCKPGTYNSHVVSLIKRGLVQSQKGPNGGIWLTAEGCAVAQSLGTPGPVK